MSLRDYVEDTIAAIATPAGRGGVGIIRVSGPAAAAIAHSMLGRLPRPRFAEYGSFLDQKGAAIDQGLALYFSHPHSFTGEDVLELQAHGGPVVLDLLLKRILTLGARMARPGEFSERAYLNNKIDLAQAEAIADLIDASTEQAARCAMHSLEGVFSDWVQNTVERLTQLRMYVEAAIDFPEEEIDFLGDSKVSDELNALLADLDRVIGEAQQGQLLREGMRIVLAGQPNVGKSSLLNQLVGRESAIVTDIPGTTRDVLREEISIDGLPVHVIDTAGLRESSNPIEQEGIRRSWQEMEQADQVLLLLDSRQGYTKEEEKILAQLPPKLAVTVIYNKIDLSGAQAAQKKYDTRTHLWLSAKDGQGMDLLREHLKACVGYRGAGEGQFMARRRHLQALEQAREFIEKGATQLHDYAAGELLAEELHQAQKALGEITGTVSSDDLLGRIFSSFCIGK
ncbi:tRNA-5-carboxymethylaminomethyl-2-thiouridine(34)synthesis protein MnmE [hydrothermal vent metagenome]|uniref:tRNA-5-carboxymethylaminomethyl-2-thiouridine(34) synthesis protein MnmE n=1 Tax=hydrothermal vent metagenome TaxID=652676 RepID=A0A3B1C3K2_9ZZZZ